MAVLNRRTLLLDLDGTLVDPALGIIRSYRHALHKMALPVADDVNLSWVIGPPLRVVLTKLLAGRGDLEVAVKLYRSEYAARGLYEAERYPGVYEALLKRAQGGTNLILCTSKPASFARRVVDYFGYSPLLSAVYGSELDGRLEDKGDLIEHLLAVERLDPNQVCMVGDRKYDIHAAARHGIPTVGVLWGYGSADELKGAGAKVLIECPTELTG